MLNLEKKYENINFKKSREKDLPLFLLSGGV